MKVGRRPETWVFAILLASYAFFWHGRDWNSASRLMLTYALGDRGTIRIDGLEDQTHDIARRLGHYYTDKTPGFSLLGLPPYLVAKHALGLSGHPLDAKGFAYWPADYWVTLGTSGLCSALTGAILVGMARGLGCGPRRAALVGLAYGLATPAFAYATMSYGHQVAALGLLGSFALLRGEDGRRPALAAALAGFLASYASVVEIQVGPVSAILGFFLLAQGLSGQRPGRTIAWFAAGAAIPAAILLGYNALAFGSPWKMGYFFLVTRRFAEVHSATNPLGLNRPDWAKLGELIWGERRGLLRYAPIVALAPLGLVVLAGRKLWGTLAVVAASIAAIFLMNLSYPEWTGGWTTGPRLLVPCLPFAMVGVASILAVGGRATTTLAVALALGGAMVILIFQGVGGRIPDGIARPLVDAAWPIWRGDRPLPGWVFGNRYARNLISVGFPKAVRGLPEGWGWLQFLPLVGFQILAIGAMLRAIREPAAKRS